MKVDIATDLVSADTHAGCPQCEYDLTGLPEPRCPECGFVFAWDDLPRLRNLPTIAFERRTSWRRVGGFFWTAGTVLLTPWIFARQCVRRMDWRAGLIFGLCCFGITPISLRFGADVKFLVVWLLTAAIYVLVQATFFWLLDWPHWRERGKSWRFWLGIGGYTSAVVMTELFRGPPLVELESIYDLIVGKAGGFIRMPDEPVLHYAQLTVWIAGLVCIVAARLRARGAAGWSVAGACGLAVISLYVMYALACTYLGTWIHGLLF